MARKHLHSLPPLIDVDCNLLHPDLKSVMSSTSRIQLGLDQVPEALQILHHPSTALANISGMISPASTIIEAMMSLELLKSCSAEERKGIDIRTTVGVHPYHCSSPPSQHDLNALRTLLDSVENKPYVSCVGETGLDYSDGFPSKENQLPWFASQINLAFEYTLPIFLHERLAFDDTLLCIDEATARHADKPIPKIIVHCFTGTSNQCAEYIKRGYYISVSGYIIKEENYQVRQCLRDGIIPLDKLMVETDSPYMGFVGNKEEFFDLEGERFSSLSSKKRKRLKSTYPNVPCALPMVVKAAWKEISRGKDERGEDEIGLDEFAAVTTQNAKSFFGL
jgi:TatD DNase family protein